MISSGPLVNEVFEDGIEQQKKHLGQEKAAEQPEIDSRDGGNLFIPGPDVDRNDAQRNGEDDEEGNQSGHDAPRPEFHGAVVAGHGEMK